MSTNSIRDFRKSHLAQLTAGELEEKRVAEPGAEEEAGDADAGGHQSGGQAGQAGLAHHFRGALLTHPPAHMATVCPV